jgi:hypothetical protein
METVTSKTRNSAICNLMIHLQFQGSSQCGEQVTRELARMSRYPDFHCRVYRSYFS